MNIIHTKDKDAIFPFLQKVRLPLPGSHKGQNGKVLVIGGSSLFHSSSLWAAEAAAPFVDMLHYGSTQENNEIFLSLKKKFRNGMVVSQKDIPGYVLEDHVIIIGPGMVRTENPNPAARPESWGEVLDVADEGMRTEAMVTYLLVHFPRKRFVIDAGALQMLVRKDLAGMEEKPVLTPHQKEYLHVFGTDVRPLPLADKAADAMKNAAKHGCIILLKAVDDIITDGAETVVVHGGNAGLTRGGTGDILAGLVAAFAPMTDGMTAAILASFILKKTADTLFFRKGFWFTNEDILRLLPETATGLFRAGTCLNRG